MKHIESPKVSVIIPTHNYAEYLPDCLDSLLAQTMQDFEIIIIDDASTDNTQEIIDRYSKIFGQKLISLKPEKKVGRGGIRNYGLNLAKGEHITFLDADDAYCPEKIEVQSRYLDEHVDVGGVSCRFYTTNQFLKEPKVGTSQGGRLDLLFGSDYTIFEESIVSLMIRKSIMNQVGLFDEKIIRGQDSDLIIRILRICKIGFINTPLFFYRQHDTNLFSLQGLRERTQSNVIFFKKLLDAEDSSRKKLARQFAFTRLSSQIYALREQSYFPAIMAWFLYLYEFNINLPLSKWAIIGIKTVVGYPVTQFVKRKISLLSAA